MAIFNHGVGLKTQGYKVSAAILGQAVDASKANLTKKIIWNQINEKKAHFGRIGSKGPAEMGKN